MHHVLGDGIALLYGFAALSDTYEANTFPFMKK
jgi:hypothetical protein